MSLRSDIEALIPRLLQKRHFKDEFDQGKDHAWRIVASDLQEILAKNSGEEA